MNGIFPALDPASDPATAEDSRLAGILSAHAAKHGWMISRSPKRHADAIRRLRRRLGPQSGLIEKVIRFIVDKDVTEPAVRDAEQLSRPTLWNWVVDLMEKNPNVTVSPAAREICSALRKRKQSWPADLDTAVQLSLTFMKEFCRKLGKFPINHVHGFDAHLRDRGFREPDSFVEQWFKDRHWVEKKLVPRHVVSADNDDFHAHGRKVAAAWGDEHDWGRLLKELGYEGGEA